MRPSPSLAAALIITACTALAATAAGAAVPGAHTRAGNNAARELLEIATTRSGVTRALMNRLDATDVIVYVTVEPLTTRSIAGYLTFVSAVAGVRYVAVKIDWNAYPLRRIVTLAHELQHALEVAASADVHDAETLRSLYKRIGYQSDGAGRWETDAARAVGTLAQEELENPKPQPRLTVPPMSSLGESAGRRSRRAP